MGNGNHLSDRQIRLMKALVDTEIRIHIPRSKEPEYLEFHIAKQRPSTGPATVYQIWPPTK